jgi:hypothetical protein
MYRSDDKGDAIDNTRVTRASAASIEAITRIRRLTGSIKTFVDVLLFFFTLSIQQGGISAFHAVLSSGHPLVLPRGRAVLLSFLTGDYLR